MTQVSKTTVLGLAPSDLITLLGVLGGAAANAMVPGATVAGMSIEQLTGLAVGVANEVPAAIQAVEEIKAHADAGTAPAPAEWASWNAAADQANAAAAAAEDKVINAS